VTRAARDVRVLPDAAALFHAAAAELSAAAAVAVARANRFTLALSGGRTPRGLYELLAKDAAYRDTLPWDRTHVFWGDERHVPPDHRDSNYRLARETLLDQVPLPAANIHRVPAEDPEAERVADRYERELRAFFTLDADGIPRFDVVLLGLGTDGHTASLFPGADALAETRRLAVATRGPVPPVERVTLTLPVLNHAACVVFLVSGADKAGIVRAVLEDSRDPPLPAQRVRPVGRLVWLLDAAAGAW
jgi:6-phosphogluconolactonase